jgi:hypothetical protein
MPKNRERVAAGRRRLEENGAGNSDLYFRGAEPGLWTAHLTGTALKTKHIEFEMIRSKTRLMKNILQ